MIRFLGSHDIFITFFHITIPPRSFVTDSCHSFFQSHLAVKIFSLPIRISHPQSLFCFFGQFHVYDSLIIFVGSSYTK